MRMVELLPALRDRARLNDKFDAMHEIILSDFHLTAPYACHFRQSWVMAEIESRRPEVVWLLGDSVELYLKDAFVRDPVWKRLQALDASVRLIPGNCPHDSARRWKEFRHFLGKIELWEKVIDIHGYRLTHGDIYDRRVRVWELLLRPLYRLAPRLRVHLLKRILPSAYSWTYSRTKTETQAIALIRERALEDAVKSGMRGLIHGHTHAPQITKRGKVSVYDLGSAGTEDRSGFIGILKDGKLELEEVPR